LKKIAKKEVFIFILINYSFILIMFLRLPRIFSLKVLRSFWIVSVSWFIVYANVSWTLQFTSSGREATWY